MKMVTTWKLLYNFIRNAKFQTKKFPQEMGIGALEIVKQKTP